MAKLPVLSAKELRKILEKQGFVIARITGSHHIMKHHDGRILPIPIHGNEIIGVGLLTRILKKELKITREEFESWRK